MYLPFKKEKGEVLKHIIMLFINYMHAHNVLCTALHNCHKEWLNYISY